MSQDQDILTMKFQNFALIWRMVFKICQIDTEKSLYFLTILILHLCDLHIFAAIYFEFFCFKFARRLNFKILINSQISAIKSWNEVQNIIIVQ